MIHFNRFIPVLRVVDMDESIGYYTRTLGFTPLWRSPNDGCGENAMLRAGDVAPMVSTGDHMGDRPSFSGTLYIDMAGVDRYYEQVEGLVTIVRPLQVMPYGQKEFGVRDCDGYVLAFSEATVT